MHDEGIKYNSLYGEVELAITNIASLGFDMKEFIEKLKEIHNDVNSKVKVNYYKGLAEASYIQSYSNGIWQLEKLKSELDKFDIYVQAQNICEYINIKLDGDLSDTELSKLVSKMIYTLKMIVKSPTIDYDNEKYIVEKIYETSYNVIKLELLHMGESQLFLFAKSEDINISYFNKLILKDIEKIDLKEEKNKRLKTKLYELGQKGIYSNYLDLDLIKLILLSDGDYNLKETLINRINALAVEIIDETTKIGDSCSTLEIALERKKDALKEVKEISKQFRKKIVSLILSVSILSGGAYGIAKLSKRLEEKTDYDKRVQIYSSEGGIRSYKEEKVLGCDAKPNDTVVLRIYGSEGTDNNYHYQVYDISNIEYNDMADYYKYVSDNYDIDGARIEIEKTDYYRGMDDTAYMMLMYFFYIFFIVLFELGSASPYREDYSWFGYIRIKNIIKKKHEVNYKKDSLKARVDDLEGLANEIINKINHNEELRKRFNELYQENKYLLDNPEELIKRVNNLATLEKVDNVKKLIKERNK